MKNTEGTRGGEDLAAKVRNCSTITDSRVKHSKAQAFRKIPPPPPPQKSQMTGATHPQGFQAKQRIICTFAAEHVRLQYKLHM